MLPVYIVLLCAAVLFGFVRLLMIGRRPIGYPPGPPTVPILGNLHQLPSHDGRVQYQEWAKQYGPIYSLMLGTKTLVILHCDTVSKETSFGKSEVCSDSQQVFTGNIPLRDGLQVLMMGNASQRQKPLKLIHSLLMARDVPNSSTRNHYHQGYLIPKGAAVFKIAGPVCVDATQHPEPTTSCQIISNQYEEEQMNQSESV